MGPADCWTNDPKLEHAYWFCWCSVFHYHANNTLPMITCQNPQKKDTRNGAQQRKRKSKGLSCSFFVLIRRTDGSLQISGAFFFSAQIYMSPVTKMMKMGFLCGPSSTSLQSTLGHKNLPWSLSVGKWLSSRLTLPTRKCCCQRINN